MYLLGAHIHQQNSQAALVIIKKRLKEVKHHYTIETARKIDKGGCRQVIIDFYHNRRYFTRKRVFSQDRRPKKDVSARPAIVIVAGPGERLLIDDLRQKDIPVEAIILEANNKAAGCDAAVRPGLGRNFAVSETELMQTLVSLNQKLRLVVERNTENDDLLSRLEQTLAGMEKQQKIPADDREALILAAAGPVWFRENVRFRQVYRTSATSVRQYK